MSERAPAGLIAATGMGYFPIAFLARLPFAMVVVGVLTLVVSARGSIALGGLTSAAVGLGTALVGPLIGAAADRLGQRPVLLAAGAANSAVLLVLCWTVYAPVPDGAVLAVSFLVGASSPQVAPMSRSRLVQIIGRRLPAERRQRTLNGTMAYESAADEIMFVFGPVIVGLLATTMHPAAPVIGAAGLILVFVTAFALHRSSTVAWHRDATAPPQAPARQLMAPRLWVVVLGVFGVGLFFGTSLTSLTSFMRDLGEPEAAGSVYGALGVGSTILALSVAWFPPRFSLRARWLTFAVVLVAAATGYGASGDLAGLVVALSFAGLGIGPTLVTQFSLGAGSSPRGRSATVMTMLGAAIIVGQSGSSAVAGAIAEESGTPAVMWGPLIAAGVILLAAVGNAYLTRNDGPR